MMAWLFHVLDTAIVAAALVAALGWLLRAWIGARLNASIQLSTNQRLAEFTQRLDATEAQVATVRAAGIDAAQQMAAAALAERVEAIKQIWLGVVEWKAASALSTLVSAMDIRMATESAGHPGTKRTMQTMLDSLQYMELLRRTNGLARWRPFVTAQAWALFAAYQGFYSARVTKAAVLMIGHRETVARLWQVDGERDVVRAAAPIDMTVRYEANPIAEGPKFLAYLEAELLAELQRTLAGEHSGPEASKHAAKIVAAVENLMNEARSVQAEAARGN